MAAFGKLEGKLIPQTYLMADTAKQLVSVYAKQQTQIAKLAKKVEELEKANGK